MKPKKSEAKQDFLKRCTQAGVDAGQDQSEAFSSCNLAWDNSNNQRDRVHLAFAPTFSLTAGEAGQKDKRSFALTGYTGKAIDTWFGKVVFNIKGIKTKAKIPVLREHQRDRVVGFGEAFKDESNFYVRGEFSGATKDAQEVLNLADEGYPWQASVGIWPKKVSLLGKDAKVKVNGKEFSGPGEIWEESEVGEISFVSLGADDNTAGVSFGADDKNKANVVFTENQTKMEDEMPKEIIEVKTVEELKAQFPEFCLELEKAAKQAGIDEERARVKEILAADADLIETKKAIEDGISAAGAYKLFFEAEKKKRALGLKAMEAEAPQSVGTEVNTDSEDKAKEQKLSGNDKFMGFARDLAAKEGISMKDATQKALNDPSFLSSWKPVGME